MSDFNFPPGRAMLALAVVLTMGLAGGAAASGSSSAPAGGRRETAEIAGGRRLEGQLEGTSGGTFQFVPADGSEPIPLEKVRGVSFEGPSLDSVAGLPPFQVTLGWSQRISGWLDQVSETEIRLEDGPGQRAVTIDRSGALALLQRPGEVQLWHEGFETLDTKRWAQVGSPAIVAEPRLEGKHALRLAAGGAAITHRLIEPVGSGRLDVAFFDDGRTVENQRWFIDLSFREPSGEEWVRAVLGWDEESLAVQSSPGRPALGVQRLARPSQPGWHRLIVRFGPQRTDLTVDGNELARGDGPAGPLVEIRLATETVGQTEVPSDLAAHVDDLRLARLTEAAGSLEIDPRQDEIRFVGGDQLFGRIRQADPDRVVVALDGQEETFPWSEVSGLYFRRAPAPAGPLEGWLVRIEWEAAPSQDPRDIDQAEGVLTTISPTAVTLATPYAGLLTIPRDRLRRLRVLGHTRRLVLDPTPHHLGDEVYDLEPRLDPPQPEGGILEVPFELDQVPPGNASLVLDVVQVAGEAPGLRYTPELKRGELRTNLRLNGELFDYLNRHITSPNEAPERVRLPIPGGLLRAGPNRLRFEQEGTRENPEYLDDLGLLGVALEFEPARPAETSQP